MTPEERARELFESYEMDIPVDVIAQAIREAERRGWERCREAAADHAMAYMRGEKALLVASIRALEPPL